jgi:hypothetical protein
MKTIIQILLFFLPALSMAQQSSYDSDGDGIPDSTDQCAYVIGTKEYRGCPIKKKITPIDRDGDGIKDVDDKCPDMFGLGENQGCPDLMKPTPQKEQSSLTSSAAEAFSTTTNLADEQSAAFKQTLLGILADSLHIFSSTGNPYPGEGNKYKTPICLPGADECYIKMDKGKTFYAQYGTFNDEAAAAQRYYSLKQKLSDALGGNDWNNTETTLGGYIDKYQVSKKGNSKSPSITTHVQRSSNKYGVYITIEQK